MSNPTELKALYVMVDPSQLARYKDLARLGGITLREYVLRALETYSTGQTVDVDNPEGATRRLNQHALRIDELEKRVAALQRSAERE